jgi:hypothetical protein
MNEFIFKCATNIISQLMLPVSAGLPISKFLKAAICMHACMYYLCTSVCIYAWMDVFGISE